MLLTLVSLLTLLVKCSACPQLCDQCIQNTNVCEKCSNGHFVKSSSGACSPCNRGCLECNSSLSCTLCTSGYYLDHGVCYQCSRFCRECFSSWPCTSCSSGYYLDSNGYCYKCSNGCIECSLESSCTQCESGYYLEIGYCNKCRSTCFECIAFSICTCPSGYYLSNGTCVQCFSSCLTCSSTTGECTSCPQMTYLLAGSCIPCNVNCISCNSTNGTCDECEDGYYGDYCSVACNGPCHGNTCHKLSGECLSRCQSGYYKSEIGCESCPDNCLLCSNGTTCTECIGHHYLEMLEDGSVACFPCDGTCLSCVQSRCIRHVMSSTINSSVFASQGPTKPPPLSGCMTSGTVIGIVVGAVLIGLTIGVVASIAVRVLLRKGGPVTQRRDSADENQEVRDPTVRYVNSYNLERINELTECPSTYESLSGRYDDSKNYSTLDGDS